MGGFVVTYLLFVERVCGNLTIAFERVCNNLTIVF